MGITSSTANKLDKALATDLPEDERYFGLENFGNTCYCNSVLQALYFCEPFRKNILDYEKSRKEMLKLIESNSNGASQATTGLNDSVKENTTPKVVSMAGLIRKRSNSQARDKGTKDKDKDRDRDKDPDREKDTALLNTSHDPDTASDATGRRQNSANANGLSPSLRLSEDNSINMVDNYWANGSETVLSSSETLLSSLADLFVTIATQKKRTGLVSPKNFFNRVRKENDLFSGYSHQDGHEFFNFLLNSIVESLQKEGYLCHRSPSSNRQKWYNKNIMNGITNSHIQDKLPPIYPGHPNTDDISAEPKGGDTFIHRLFEGHLTNEVKCLCCESVTRKIESFLDLSVDIEQNSSLTSVLRNFSSTEIMQKQNKFFCNSCCTLQEAERRMKIKTPPHILALHLKRFKFMEHLQRYKKLSHRVVFPLELRLCNTSEDAEDPDRMYSLFAVVVHVGSGPNHGHYVSLIKSAGHWLLFDDDYVEPKEEHELQHLFGTYTVGHSNECGYILFYERVQSMS